MPTQPIYKPACLVAALRATKDFRAPARTLPSPSLLSVCSSTPAWRCRSASLAHTLKRLSLAIRLMALFSPTFTITSATATAAPTNTPITFSTITSTASLQLLGLDVWLVH
eukprot:GHVT01095090.1.p1 GENE.GHVT01095090.1~~GHVT01095090.1.p1  ORF type:complete len:111 (+),score=5.60 GHVT01095090.1:866-1198(+)